MNSNEFSQIVPVNRISKESFHELPKGLVVSNKSQYVTVDSGACDSIIPPNMFNNTTTVRTHEFGKTYGACGGETVTNIGQKSVKCLVNNNNVKRIDFQVGDKITRGLCAVSKIAESGAGVCMVWSRA